MTDFMLLPPPSLSLIVFMSTSEFSLIFTSDSLPCPAGVGEVSKWLTECLIAGWVQPTIRNNIVSHLRIPQESQCVLGETDKASPLILKCLIFFPLLP